MRSLLYDGYIPDSKKFAMFLESYASFNNSFSLSEWQVEEGFEINLELSRKFEDTEIIIASEAVETEEAKMLKKNVLSAIDTIQFILKRAYDSEDIDDLASTIEILSIKVDEMNEILNDN